jgi:hypothetical protein
MRYLNNKFFYFKLVKEEYIFPFQKLIYMKYNQEDNSTTFLFNEINKTHFFKSDGGNLLPKILEITNRDYTKGVIITDDNKIEEII